MLKKICLLGSRKDGHAGVIYNIIKENNLYEVIGFFDDNPELQNKNIFEVPILGRISDFPENIPENVTNFFICSGNNDFRKYCYNLIIKYNFNLVNVLHPSAIISKTATIGNGVFAGQNVVINNNSIIGNCVIINTSATIDHDNIIEDFVNISPGCHTSGRVLIKEGSFLGTGSIIIPDVVINENVLIGAGSVVINDISSSIKVVGIPAREIVRKGENREN